MLPTLTLVAALLLPAPAQDASVDTTHQFRGYGNLPYAWGTLVQRNGKVLRAYLPTATRRGFEMVVPYYPQAPAPTGKPPRPKLVAAPNVRWMRVGSQYWELLGHTRAEDGSLALRRQAGPVELFAVQAAAPAPIFTALDPNPVLSSPVGAAQLPNLPTTWYLRRAAGTPVVVESGNFANQVAAFLHDNPELARRVAAEQPGYRYENLESIIQQYNQHARR